MFSYQHREDGGHCGIPDQLMMADRWVCRDREKIPYDPRSGRKADTTNPKTWSSYKHAEARRTRYAGLGFVFGDGFAGVDLDHCRDTATGEIAEWALEIVQALDSYTEISPSGTGLHILVLGTVPSDGKKTAWHDGAVEMYDQGRYFTVTGDHLPFTPAMLEERSAELAQLHQQIFARRQRKKPATPATVSATSGMHDLDLIEFGKRQKDGGKFARLWDGDISGYPSHSEADQALVNKLVFLGIDDPVRIDAAFRMSGLMREKWDRDDYRTETIKNALSTVSERYQPGLKGVSCVAQDETASRQADSSTEAKNGFLDVSRDKELVRLQKIIAKQQEMLAKKDTEIRELKQQLSWERRMRDNKTHTPTERVVYSAIRQEYQKAQARGDKEFMVYYPAIGEKVGLSGKTVQTTVARGEASGYMKRHTVQHLSQAGPNKGKEVERVVLELSEKLLEHPEMLKRDEKRKQGGSTICPGCGRRHAIVKTVYTCVECGTTWEGESRMLREKDPPPEQENASATHCDTEYSENFSMPPEAAEPQTTFADDLPAQPTERCRNCGRRVYWWRGDTWICAVCHPPKPAWKNELEAG